MDKVIEIILMGILGLLTGSFMNVVVYRVPRGIKDINVPLSNIAWPGSCCPQCQHPIRYRDNVPLLSWLCLQGRCRDCHARISLRYPLTEAACGLMFALITSLFPLYPEALAICLLFWFLLALTQIDAQHCLLPDKLTLPLLWLGLLYHCLFIGIDLRDAVLGAMAGYLALWLVYQAFRLLAGKEGMGFGDFKLLAALGAWCGWQALPSILLLSSMLALIYAVGRLILYGNKQPHIAFGPWLSLAGWLSFLWQSWYG
ncbi:prepilin peptidase [Scandinavium lactucae]|uniref:Prepilin leader peptidase/N-methyltransferase n=1 Tax=Scandinavium lactucae TaxID=3095028 RepID=A0ABU4QNS7_9ENTR|nr:MULTISPECIES: A24 family peptidase [unclassified Scandinavium]MDX6040029.1 A24 family peptidase [Scandinavium sp. V105_6]MDX6048576.1 A24 family peptidase [Scandinavium sp. V105_1]